MPLTNSKSAPESPTDKDSATETQGKQLKFSWLSLRLNKFSVSLLGFLLILFAIATNTQSGWLFVLISFLLSSLFVDGIQALITVMRAVDSLKLSLSPTYANSDLTPALNNGYVGDCQQIYSFSLRLDNQSSKAFSHIKIRFVDVTDSINYAWNKEQSLYLALQPDQEVLEPSPTTLKILSNLYDLQSDQEIKQLSDRLKQAGQTTPPTDINSLKNEQIVILDTVGAHKAAQLNYKICPKRRGIYSAAPSSLIFYSCLGLVSFTLTVDPNICPLYVAPEAFDTNSTQVSSQKASDRNTYISQKSLSETENFHGLHEFQMGENIRHIHWPTSARMGDLMVREFQVEPPQKEKLPLLLEIIATVNDKVDISQASCALEMALVLVNSLAKLCKKEKRELHVFFETNQGVAVFYENSELLSYPLRQFLAEANLNTTPKYSLSQNPQESFNYAKEQFIQKYERALLYRIALHPYLDPEMYETKVSIFWLMQPPNTDPQTSDDFAAAVLKFESKGITARCVTIQDDPKAMLEELI